MRVAAERRADGVYVAAGVELIEPEYRHQSALAPGGVVVTPSRVARLGDKLGTETAKRLRNATGHRSFSYTRTPVLCKREADLLSTLTAVGRFRAKQRQSPLALQCRQCGAPMTAKRPSKAFCSEKCRVAAHREREQ